MESKDLEQKPSGRQEKNGVDWRKVKHQFRILAARYWLLLRRDRGAFLFQLFQGILVALLLWIVAPEDTFSASGFTTASTTLLIMSIAASWLGILNASKEIVKEKRVFGRERRYGIGSIPYVLSKIAVLGLLGIWQVVTLVVISFLRLAPENHIGTFGRILPESIQAVIPLGIEWIITLELMLCAGLALGLLISSISKSIDQATMLMFPAMLVQILLAGILFDVGPLAYLSFTHWGVRALGNSLNLVELASIAAKQSDPILKRLDFTSSAPVLVGIWVFLLVFMAVLLALTCWRQGWADKARIPDD